MLLIDITQAPAFIELAQRFTDLAKQVHELKAAQTDYVREKEAQRITGLSHTTLWRERQNPDSLIKWKEDHGVYYERASLHAHNASRAVVRRRA